MQPEGFVEKGKEHLVCNLRRNIYGLKQSPRCWSSVLDSKIKSMGLEQTMGDPLFVKEECGEIFIIAVYVYDSYLLDPSRQSDVEKKLKQRQSRSSKRRRKRVENANGIDVGRSTLFRRLEIGVSSTSEYRRCLISTLHFRRRFNVK